MPPPLRDMLPLAAAATECRLTGLGTIKRRTNQSKRHPRTVRVHGHLTVVYGLLELGGSSHTSRPLRRLQVQASSTTRTRPGASTARSCSTTPGPSSGAARPAATRSTGCSRPSASSTSPPPTGTAVSCPTTSPEPSRRGPGSARRTTGATRRASASSCPWPSSCGPSAARPASCWRSRAGRPPPSVGCPWRTVVVAAAYVRIRISRLLRAAATTTAP
ncbi:hypothetical protein ACQJBY_021529 [Aegilops geniculata]